jgi:hypothetical protein
LSLETAKTYSDLFGSAAGGVETRSKWDNGHPFRSWKNTARWSHPHWNVRLPGGYFDGPLIPADGPGNASIFNFKGFSYPDVDLSYGVTAMRNTRPTKEQANTSQMLYELLLDLPKIPLDALSSFIYSYKSKKRLETYKRDVTSKVSGEYLNAVFGWSPLIADVLKICEAIVRSDELLRQYSRDSGKGVRRRYSFDTTVESKQLAVGYPLDWGGIERYQGGPSQSVKNALFLPGQYPGYGSTQVYSKTSREVWFAGQWSYYLHEGSSFLDQIETAVQKAKYLLGLKGLTPDLVWELLPFSWLSDWFVNIGNLISVNQALQEDSLVLRYGYLMQHDVTEIVFKHPSLPFRTGSTGELSAKLTYETKQRVRATPYGFGLNPSQFTTSQWAILAALGLTMGNKSLRL